MTALAFALDALAGYDAADPVTREGIGHMPPTYTAFFQPHGLRGARIGVLTNYASEGPVDPEVARLVREAAGVMRAEGAEVLDVTMPALPEFGDILDGGPTDVGVLEFKFVLDGYLAEHPTAPVHSLTEIVASGKYDASVGPFLAPAAAQPYRHTPEYHARLVHHATAKSATIGALLEHHLDALVYPTIRQKASKLGEPPRGINCQLSAHTGFPALTVPAGFTPDGVPVGVELLGPAWSEGSLIRLAYAFDKPRTIAVPRRPRRRCRPRRPPLRRTDSGESMR